MGERKSKFTYCVKTFGLGALLGVYAVGWAQAQSMSPSPSPTGTATSTSTQSATGTPTPTQTNSPTQTGTPTQTWTYTPDLFAAPTQAPAWDQSYLNPTATFTPTDTPWGYVAPDTPTATDTPLGWVPPTATNTPLGWEGSPTATPNPSSSATPTFTPTGTIFPTDTYTPTWTFTPVISRGALALMPTAFSNGWDHWDGLNWDISFSYYIGSIAEGDKDTGSTDYLSPLRLWLLTNDLKYGWLEASGDRPAIASGLLMTLLLSGGNPGETGSASQNFQLTGNSMGGVYTVLSVPLTTNNAVHFGIVHGFQNEINSIGLQGFAPTLNYGDLFAQLSGNFANELSTANVTAAPPDMFYTGWNTRFLGTNWKFEIWKPFPMYDNPVLLNTQVDGLFAFNLAYMRWDEGFSLLGYFDFRFTIVPEAPAY